MDATKDAVTGAFNKYRDTSYGLDFLPKVETFLTLCALRCGSLVVSLVGILHPALVTMYVHRDMHEAAMSKVGNVLSALYFVASLMLLTGVLLSYAIICVIFVYFVVLYVFTCFWVMIVTAWRLISYREWRVSTLTCFLFPVVLFACILYGGIVVSSYYYKIK